MDDFEFIPNQFIINLKYSFIGIRVLGQRLFPTNFELNMPVFYSSEDSLEYEEKMTNTLKKMKLFNSLLNNSLIIASTNQWAIDKFLSTNDDLDEKTNNIILCPNDVSDATLCELFLAKYKSLMGDIFHSDSCELKISDSNMIFTFVGSLPCDTFPNKDEWLSERNWFDKPWWFRNDSSTIDVIPGDDEDITILPHWSLRLEKRSNTIIDQGNIRKIFKPTIIDGGLND